MIVRACISAGWMSVVSDEYLANIIAFTCNHRRRQVINSNTLCAGRYRARSGWEKAQVGVFTIVIITKAIIIELAFYKSIWIFLFITFGLPATAKRAITVENCIVLAKFYIWQVTNLFKLLLVVFLCVLRLWQRLYCKSCASSFVW